MTNTSPVSQANLGIGTLVSVDYDKKDAITKAIKAGKFDYKHVGVHVSYIPLAGTEKAKLEVFELHLGHTTFSADLPDELDQRGVAFADPLTALRYAAKLPDQQRKYPLVILFEFFLNNHRNLCYLFLSVDGSSRSIAVSNEISDVIWFPSYRFLVVRKSAGK